MKRRIEDQILLLAYDELDGNEVEALKRRLEADPALRELYEEHLRVRQATHAVPAPPPPLLSSERLRERILSESVTRRKIGWGWASLGAGAALAGALAYLLMAGPADSEKDDDLTQRPVLTVALNDLPAPHEWVPSLINDISVEAVPLDRRGAGQTDRTTRTGQTGKTAQTGQTRRKAITQPAQNAAQGAVSQSAPDEEEPTVVVIGANGRAVELEGTDGVAFGG